MYDRLWEEDPDVQQTRAEAKAEGKTEGLQNAVVTVVKVRFPMLADIAQQKVSQINNPDILNFCSDKFLPKMMKLWFVRSSVQQQLSIYEETA